MCNAITVETSNIYTIIQDTFYFCHLNILYFVQVEVLSVIIYFEFCLCSGHFFSHLMVLKRQIASYQRKQNSAPLCRLIISKNTVKPDSFELGGNKLDAHSYATKEGRLKPSTLPWEGDGMSLGKILLIWHTRRRACTRLHTQVWRMCLGPFFLATWCLNLV